MRQCPDPAGKNVPIQDADQRFGNSTFGSWLLDAGPVRAASLLCYERKTSLSASVIPAEAGIHG
jgi:hypothetical protein